MCIIWDFAREALSKEHYFMNIEVTRINAQIQTDPAKFVKEVNEDYIYRLKKNCGRHNR